MDQVVFANNRSKYLHHIEEFKKFKGSALLYCKMNELSADKFSYYKNFKKSKAKISKFTKVEVHPPRAIAATRSVAPIKEKTIDPEWLASLIHSLLNKQ